MSGILDINKILNDYSHDVQEAIQREAEKIAKDGTKKLKSTSPINRKNSVHRGKYSKGWRAKTDKGRGYVHSTIYNATDYQLTHLLEDGHLTRNGKKTKPIKHIEPINNECCLEFEKNVEKIIANGG
jgi:hypothetical protein